MQNVMELPLLQDWTELSKNNVKTLDIRQITSSRILREIIDDDNMFAENLSWQVPSSSLHSALIFSETNWWPMDPDSHTHDTDTRKWRPLHMCMKHKFFFKEWNVLQGVTSDQSERTAHTVARTSNPESLPSTSDACSSKLRLWPSETLSETETNHFSAQRRWTAQLWPNRFAHQLSDPTLTYWKPTPLQTEWHSWRSHADGDYSHISVSCQHMITKSKEKRHPTYRTVKDR